MTYGDGLFVAVGGHDLGRGGVRCTIVTSTDGILWTNQSPSVPTILSDVTWGNGLFVAVGYVASEGPPAPRILASSDGINWTQESQTLGGVAVAYGNNLFVAIGGSGEILTSSNAVDWSVELTGAWLYDVAFGNGQFVVARGFRGGFVSLLLSRDGINWQEVDPDIPRLPSDIAFGNGIFVAVGERHDECNCNQSFIVTSPDALHWETPQQFAGSTGCLAFGNGTFVLAGNGKIFHSDPFVRLELQLHERPALTICGPVPGRYRIEAAEDAGPLSDWRPLTTLSLTNSPQVWEDDSSSNSLRRFYRAVLLP